MKAVILDIDGTVNTSVTHVHKLDIAARHALRGAGIAYGDEVFEEELAQMRAAHSDDVYESVLWQFFRPHARSQGWDEARSDREWTALVQVMHGEAGYTFVERPGVRAVLEEVKFATVDTWGDVPVLIAMAHGAAMVRNALEHARLDGLFDTMALSGERGLRPSDTRLLMTVMEEFGLTGEQCIAVGSHQSRLLNPASLLGMTTVLFRADSGSDGGMAPRGPWEQPDRECPSVAELGDLLLAWIHAPPPRRRRRSG